MKIVVIAVLAFLLYMLQSVVYRKMWNQKLNVILSFEENELFVGQQGQLCELIENEKYFPLPILKVKFQCKRGLNFETSQNAAVTDMYYRNDMFSVMPMQKITRRLTFTAAKRGYYTIKNVDLIGTDFLLTSENICEFPVGAGLYVYPKPMDTHFWEQAFGNRNGTIVMKRRWPEDPFEYRGIREYWPGDDMKRINWKATAKTDELRVNERNSTTLNTIRIFLNLDDSGILKNEEMVEAAISLAAGIAQSFIQKEFMVAFYCNSKDCVTKQITKIRESSGEGHMNLIYRMLARLDTKECPGDFASDFEEELKYECSEKFTVFVTVNLYGEFVKVLQDYRELTDNFCCLMPVAERDKKEISQELQDKVQLVRVKER